MWIYFQPDYILLMPTKNANFSGTSVHSTVIISTAFFISPARNFWYFPYLWIVYYTASVITPSSVHTGKKKRYFFLLRFLGKRLFSSPSFADCWGSKKLIKLRYSFHVNKKSIDSEVLQLEHPMPPECGPCRPSVKLSTAESITAACVGTKLLEIITS